MTAQARLLVSVRSVDEAAAALAGGCDILDVKEPANGPLGRASQQVVAEVCQLVAREQSPVPVSMALGELADWGGGEKSDEAALPAAMAYAKLGLSGMARQSDWQSTWCRLRRRVGSRTGWIAVAYADGDECGAPEVEEIVRAGIETGCVGVLIDTWCKQSGDLLNHLDPQRLAGIRRRTKDAGLLLALAGRIGPETLGSVLACQPDVVAVRSAACRGGDRNQDVAAEAVAELSEQLRLATIVGPGHRRAG